MAHLSQLALDANSNQLTNTMDLLERHEQIVELQRLVGSNIAAESVRLLKEFQDDDPETTRGMMRLICNTQLKVLKKISFIALLRRQLAHGLSLDVDDPVDVAYHEKTV
ncbi:hypothetical protein Tco_0692842 [Tanacetum coccineum]